MDQSNLLPQPSQNSLFSIKNFLFLLLYSSILIILSVSTTYFILQARQNLPTYIQPALIPTQTYIPIQSSPSPTLPSQPNETENWMVYSNKNLSFKYPPDWSQAGFIITSKNPKIRLVIVPNNSTMMNECMIETATETKNNLVVKKFKRVTDGAMCSTSNSTPRQIWIMPARNKYSPGVMYEYSSTDSQIAEAYLDQILSTFKFFDQNLASTPQPQRIIEQKQVEGWQTFKSSTGYSLQHPPEFIDFDKSGEQTNKNGCEMFLTNNVGGILSFLLTPYSGGSRRELYFSISPNLRQGYNNTFEETPIQNIKSLLIESGPIGDSGSGTGVVIPSGKTALIIFWSNRGKKDSEIIKLLQSITISSNLDITKCGQN